MPRSRTATNVLEAKGAFKKDPQRRRPNEPQGNGVFDKTPPAHLKEEEKTCWAEVVELVPKGVLTGSDPISVEIVAVMLAQFRKTKAETNASVMVRLTSEMNKLGLNPSGRASLIIDKTKSNPFDGF